MRLRRERKGTGKKNKSMKGPLIYRQVDQHTYHRSPRRKRQKRQRDYVEILWLKLPKYEEAHEYRHPSSSMTSNRMNLKGPLLRHIIKRGKPKTQSPKQ